MKRLLIPLLFFLPVSIWAGEVWLEWDVLDHPNVAGYEVCWGPFPGTWDECQNVGLTSGYRIEDLRCAYFYYNVRAFSDQGITGPFSDGISGYPSVPLPGQPGTVAEDRGLCVPSVNVRRTDASSTGTGSGD